MRLLSAILLAACVFLLLLGHPSCVDAWSLPSISLPSWVSNLLPAPKSPSCPPPEFDALPSTFNISSYISAPWYVQQQVREVQVQVSVRRWVAPNVIVASNVLLMTSTGGGSGAEWQMPVSYQEEDSLFCVRATYSYLSPSSPNDGLKVDNYANKGRVNGPSMVGSSSWFELTATIPDISRPSKLLVGPVVFGKSFPNSARGDYWVVAAGPNPSGPYDWAIVSGGPPSTVSGSACKTGSRWPLVARFQTNNIGLWLFSRTPTGNVNQTAAMRAKAQALGLDLGVLKPVQQVNCTYSS